MPRPAPHPIARSGLIRDPAQVRALASPVRQEIVDALTAAGPCSVADLAAHVGRPPDALYFHLRRLVGVGLVLERDPRRNGRHVAAIYDLPARPLRLAYDGGAAHGRAIHTVVAAALRLGSRDFGRAMAEDLAVADGPRRNLWGGRVKGWVSQADLAEINRLIGRLTELVRSGPPPQRIAPDARRPHSFSFVLAPVGPAKSRSGKGASR